MSTAVSEFLEQIADDVRFRLLTHFEFRAWTRLMAFAAKGPRPGVIEADYREILPRELRMDRKRLDALLQKMERPALQMVFLGNDGSIEVMDFPTVSAENNTASGQAASSQKAKSPAAVRQALYRQRLKERDGDLHMGMGQNGVTEGITQSVTRYASDHNGATASERNTGVVPIVTNGHLEGITPSRAPGTLTLNVTEKEEESKSSNVNVITLGTVTQSHNGNGQPDNVQRGEEVFQFSSFFHEKAFWDVLKVAPETDMAMKKRLLIAARVAEQKGFLLLWADTLLKFKASATPQEPLRVGGFLSLFLDQAKTRGEFPLPDEMEIPVIASAPKDLPSGGDDIVISQTVGRLISRFNDSSSAGWYRKAVEICERAGQGHLIAEAETATQTAFSRPKKPSSSPGAYFTGTLKRMCTAHDIHIPTKAEIDAVLAEDGDIAAQVRDSLAQGIGGHHDA